MFIMTESSNINLEEILANVFNVNFETQNELARTFVRFQEYFENPVFKGKTFRLDEFKDWYIANSPKGKKTGKFTYFQDWDGFNLPSDTLDPFYKGRFDPLSKEEIKLLDEFEPKRNTDFYMIGTYGDITIATMKHEISHGLFYTNPEYKKQVLQVVDNMDPEAKKMINQFLSESGGYHPDVWQDETQAYLLDRRCLGANKVSGKGLKNAGEKIKRIFKEFYKI
jgi:hypothetical protein